MIIDWDIILFLIKPYYERVGSKREKVSSFLFRINYRVIKAKMFFACQKQKEIFNELFKTPFGKNVDSEAAKNASIGLIDCNRKM